MNRWRVSWAATSLLVVVAFFSAASQVFASPAPVRTGDMEVQVWPGVTAGEVLVIVGVTLPDSTPLPATVRIPIVPGTKVTWAGELTTGTAESDLAVQAKIVKGKGADFAEFTLSTFRHAQIELGGLQLSEAGTVISGKVDFIQSAPAGVTGFAVRIPATASDVKITPAPPKEPDHNAAGESLYTLPSKELKAGQKAVVEFSYDTALPSAKAPMDATRKLVLALSVAIVAVVIALVAYLVTQKRREGTAPDEDDNFDA